MGAHLDNLGLIAKLDCTRLLTELNVGSNPTGPIKVTRRKYNGNHL